MSLLYPFQTWQVPGSMAWQVPRLCKGISKTWRVPCILQPSVGTLTHLGTVYLDLQGRIRTRALILKPFFPSQVWCLCIWFVSAQVCARYRS